MSQWIAACVQDTRNLNVIGSQIVIDGMARIFVTAIPFLDMSYIPPQAAVVGQNLECSKDTEQIVLRLRQAKFLDRVFLNFGKVRIGFRC